MVKTFEFLFIYFFVMEWPRGVVWPLQTGQEGGSIGQNKLRSGSAIPLFFFFFFQTFLSFYFFINF
jgi:hypothetical protein